MITMLPEIGLFALILALCCAFVQCVLPAIGVTTGRQHFMALAGPATSVQWLFTVISYCVLTISFLRDDFSVTYVAMTSNTLTPIALQNYRRLGWSRGVTITVGVGLGVLVTRCRDNR